MNETTLHFIDGNGNNVYTDERVVMITKNRECNFTLDIKNELNNFKKIVLKE